MPTKRIGRRFAGLLALGWLFTLPASAQVAVAPMQVTRQQFFNGTGAVLSAGCVNFFATGTSTPQAIYADSTGTSQLQNPLTLDSTGSASVWMTNTGYDIVMNTGVTGQLCSVALGTQLWKEVNKNPFSIVNAGSNYIIASGTSDPAGSAGMLAYRTDIPCFRGFITTWNCFARLDDAQTFTNKTFDISANTLKNSTNTAGHYPRNNGTQYVDSVLVAGDAVKSYANEGVTGTTLNFVTKIVGAPSTAVRASNLDTGGAIGICTSGCGLVGAAQIANIGLLSCAFDGATTANDYVQMSATTGGQCHDSGAAFPTNGNQVLGRVLSTNAVSGTYQMDFWAAEVRPLPPAAVVTAAKADLTAQAANIASTPLITPAANGFYRASCYIVLTQAATTSSTIPNCNIVYTDADSNIVETMTFMIGSSGNTVGTFGTLTTASATGGIIYAKSGASISYSTTAYASVGATPMQFAIHVRLEGPF